MNCFVCGSKTEKKKTKYNETGKKHKKYCSEKCANLAYSISYRFKGNEEEIEAFLERKRKREEKKRRKKERETIRKTSLSSRQVAEKLDIGYSSFMLLVNDLALEPKHKIGNTFLYEESQVEDFRKKIKHWRELKENEETKQQIEIKKMTKQGWVSLARASELLKMSYHNLKTYIKLSPKNKEQLKTIKTSFYKYYNLKELKDLVLLVEQDLKQKAICLTCGENTEKKDNIFYKKYCSPRCSEIYSRFNGDMEKINSFLNPEPPDPREWITKDDIYKKWGIQLTEITSLAKQFGIIHKTFNQGPRLYYKNDESLWTQAFRSKNTIKLCSHSICQNLFLTTGSHKKTCSKRCSNLHNLHYREDDWMNKEAYEEKSNKRDLPNYTENERKQTTVGKALLANQRYEDLAASGTITMLECNSGHCGEKPYTDFYKDLSYARGRRNDCKECSRKRSKLKAERNKKEGKTWSPKTKIRHLFYGHVKRDIMKNTGTYPKELTMGNVWKALEEKCGYTDKEAAEFLEAAFDHRMNWKNHGRLHKTEFRWQVDHIQQRKDLPYKSLDDPLFVECWRKENLRPLCARENNNRR